MSLEVRGQRSEVRRWRAGWLLLTCVVLGLRVGGEAHAQAPAAGSSKMYTNKLHFRLPFSLPDSERQKLNEVQLYVKMGAEPWACKESVGPAQTSFSYKATQDGEYWFGIVTVDRAGRSTPAD